MPSHTPAFDFNFFELLTLGIFTTEGEKIIIIKTVLNLRHTLSSVTTELEVHIIM